MFNFHAVYHYKNVNIFEKTSTNLLMTCYLHFRREQDPGSRGEDSADSETAVRAAQDLHATQVRSGHHRQTQEEIPPERTGR